MGGDRTLFDILYGRKLTDEEIASQPMKMVLYESLLYDNEIEWSSMKDSGEGKKGQLLIPGKSNAEIKKMIFEMKYPEYKDAIVTLLTTQEYLNLASATENHYRNLLGENPKE